ncbi:MAG TPA: hypothetical protein VFX97_20715 [Pyrinomonadaceae bacterium]|nr:hypothetical protein [Pyrinomonadaceae bacterium]
MSERKPSSTVDALTTAYCIVLTAWCFLNGYALQWLIGVPLGSVAYLVGRRVRHSKRKEK